MTESTPDGGSDSVSMYEGVRAALATFEEGPTAVHVAVVAAGVAVWIGSYVGVMELTGWASVAAADGATAVAARRHAAAGATGVMGLYYGLAMTRTYGGPLLNFVVPVVAVAFMPDAVYTLFRPSTAEAMVTTAGTVAGRYANNPAYVADMLTIWIPGWVGLLGPLVVRERMR